MVADVCHFWPGETVSAGKHFWHDKPLYKMWVVHTYCLFLSCPRSSSPPFPSPLPSPPLSSLFLPLPFPPLPSSPYLPIPVALFPFEDHNAPPFELIMPFCLDMEEWFAQSPKNVAIVHCKAGKVTVLATRCLLVLARGSKSL